jgi:hypothetical protein
MSKAERLEQYISKEGVHIAKVKRVEPTIFECILNYRPATLIVTFTRHQVLIHDIIR